jgi:ribosomal protein S27E
MSACAVGCAVHMTTYSAQLGFADALSVPPCPGCGAALQVIDGGAGATLRCRRCGQAWLIELGRLSRIELGGAPTKEAQCASD